MKRYTNNRDDVDQAFFYLKRNYYKEFFRSFIILGKIKSKQRKEAK